MTMTRRNVLCSLSAAVAGLACTAAAPARGLALEGGRENDATDGFLAAVKAGDEDEVRRRLAALPSLAATRDAAGLSALLHAHLAGFPRIAALLATTRLELGVEFDLAECVFEEDWKRMVELAALDPAAPNALHPIGGNLLYAGALAGSTDLYRIRALGCDRDGAPPGGSGFTPARAAMEQITLPGAWIAAADLLGNGSDPNARQRSGDSVLHGAVRRRSEALVRVAVRKGANVAARDDSGRTPLDLARALAWPEGVALLEHHERLPRDHRASRFLCDANGDAVRRPDLRDVPQAKQNEVTGASHANLERLRALVASDPRLVFAVSTDDELAIEASAHMGNRDLMRFHLDHGAPCSLPTAVSLGDPALIRRHLDRDPRLVHERGAHDFALMHYAAIGGGGVEIAALLHERGAAIDQESVGLTTLHWSVRRDLPELTTWLIEHGADVDAVSYRWDRRGETPLQVALKDGNAQQARILRAAGARG
ncbi:MAG: ankyrin repeat domain-containing protein [Planctomycetes bacterium]|nr:ankyrin repeat domain-containing protein [Planctomycetota bacterium]